MSPPNILAMSEPLLFMLCLGGPLTPFNMWMRIFNNYLLVINAKENAWPEVCKRATLLYCLGAERQQIFYSLPDTGDTFPSAVTALEKHFTPKVNVVIGWHAFRKHRHLMRLLHSMWPYCMTLLETLCIES